VSTRNAALPFLFALALLAALPALAQGAQALTLYFYRNGQEVAVSRPGALSGDAGEDAARLLAGLLAGPTSAERAAGLVSALPPGAELAAVVTAGEEVVVDLRLPPAFLHGELDPAGSDAAVQQIVKTLHPLGLHRVQVRAAELDAEMGFVPLSDFLPAPVVPAPETPANDEPLPDRAGRPADSQEAAPDGGQPPVPGQGQPQGALSGKAVWLSAGHGWYWSETLSRWTTQRPNCYGIVEDFSNAEAVNYYLARYLWNAGAEAWLVRERAMIDQEVIVDNDAGAPGYVETGDWATSTSPGYEDGTYRWAITHASGTATATWTPDLPEAGWYAVWAWYRHGTNRPIDARYEIHHAGGVTPVSISQEVHGLTWRYLGEYYFEGGTGGHVTLVDESADIDQAVIADAVRFGGGQGTIVAPGGTSGRPRWEEAAKYWAQYQGAPAEVYASDVTARPLYAEWEAARGEPGEAADAVYISWHTNAGGGTGTDSFIHVSEPTTGSLELQDWVHTELIHDLRGAWDPDWVNRGQKAADFGELRELSIMPGVLLEVAFHDTEDPGDADDLREPYFRQVAARAVYQGIVKYHAAREGTPVHLLPEPPERLAARSTGPGQGTLTWVPPPCCDGVLGDEASSYKVYHSTGGRAFDGGVEVAEPSLVIEGLSPSSLHYFRVTALNAGGESFPTPVVAVRTPLFGGAPSLLLVDGFDRLDAMTMVPQYEAPFLGTAQRMFLERMNSYGYAVQHAEALATCGLAFDGAVNEAVREGDLALAGYAAVDWFVGEDSVADASLNGVERALLAAYLDGGGRLLLSGSEIGYDLVAKGRDPAFYTDYLRAEYLGDDAGSYDYLGLEGGPFAGLVGTFDDGSGGIYDVGYPDQLGDIPGSTLVLSYPTGLGGGAGLAYDSGPGNAAVVYLGFPLESIVDEGQRAALACAAADYLLGGAAQAGNPRLINPGFEGGADQSAWQVSPEGNAYPVLASRAELPAYVEPRGGDGLAWLGGYDPGLSTTVALTQVVALPAGEPSVGLSLSWFVEPGSPSPGDVLTLGVYDLNGTLLAPLLALDEQAPAGAWQASSFALDAFAGQTVQLAFQATTTHTAFFADEVRLVTDGPLAADELRALWADAYHPGLKSRQQIDELVETAQAASLNALVVQVRRRGDTYYPSALDPWAADADPGFDALAYLIERAHAAGIEVHAWATTLAIWNLGTVPADPSHTYYLHGPGASGRDYWLMTNQVGKEDAGGIYYLDPGHPDVVDYTVAIYEELATNYDLDGVHLDRVRYPWQNWGYNPTAVARFQAQTGRSDVPDASDPAWLQWRRDQVTALVRKIYLAVTAIDPHLRVSAATSAVGSPPDESYPWESRDPYNYHLQDWRTWLEEGIVDLALPMIYRVDEEYPGHFDGWSTWAKDHQYGRGLVVGTGLYKNSLPDSMDQWQRVRQPSPLGNQALGMCGYSYATPSSEGDAGRALANAAVTYLFDRSAAAPALPWKDTPTLGHLAGTLVQQAPCFDLDGMRVQLSGLQARELAADGSGWFGAVDLLPGEYLLSVDLGLPEAVTVPVAISAGLVTQVEVQLPFCGSHRLYLPLILKR
jgi:uncharacterized lipoprotein YddW (UPF0748 family)